MKFPIYVHAEKFVVTNERIHPLWVVSYENIAAGTRFTLRLAHPLQIAEEMESERKKGSFIERMTNDDKEALALWERIKAELDVYYSSVS
jgi:hypothetical protein